jgi:tetratricopeptide (TPR) repeat protein
LDAEQWVVELGRKDYGANENARKLDSTLERMDSASAFRFLDQLQEKGKSEGDHFRARFNCVKAKQLFSHNSGDHLPEYPVSVKHIREQVTKLFSSAMDLAYKTEDDYLVAYVSYMYAVTILRFGEVGTSILYAKNSIDLYDKLSYNIPAAQYQSLAELLYMVREYEDCIWYGEKAVIAWKRSLSEDRFRQAVNCMNTVALGYHRQQKYDLAFLFYMQALEMAKDVKSPVWMGIISGNMAQIYFVQKQYDTAYRMFITDYKTSKDSGFYDNAANSLQWAARTSLALGKKQRALTEVREAFQLLKLWPSDNYLKNTYYTATQIFREMANYDSAFYYNNLYSTLNDSLEKVVATNSLAITRARLNDMVSQYNIQKLNKQKKVELIFRNVTIAFILLLSSFVLLMVNRKRLKTQVEKDRLEQANLSMEREIISAREQLNRFTQMSAEKANLIEKLEEELKGKDAGAEHELIISELSHQTILTEEHWSKFKSLFESLYPGFFTKLKEKFPDITTAEQRMAALTRLHLTTRQIAAMLGISLDSVHKSRQRLRQRFHVEAAINLDEIVAGL